MDQASRTFYESQVHKLSEALAALGVPATNIRRSLAGPKARVPAGDRTAEFAIAHSTGLEEAEPTTAAYAAEKAALLAALEALGLTDKASAIQCHYMHPATWVRVGQTCLVVDLLAAPKGQ